MKLYILEFEDGNHYLVSTPTSPVKFPKCVAYYDLGISTVAASPIALIPRLGELFLALNQKIPVEHLAMIAEHI